MTSHLASENQSDAATSLQHRHSCQKDTICFAGAKTDLIGKSNIGRTTEELRHLETSFTILLHLPLTARPAAPYYAQALAGPRPRPRARGKVQEGDPDSPGNW